MKPLPPYVDRHGGRHLSDEEAQAAGVQPHPFARRLIHDAALAGEYYSEAERETYTRTHNPDTRNV